MTKLGLGPHTAAAAALNTATVFQLATMFAGPQFAVVNVLKQCML